MKQAIGALIVAVIALLVAADSVPTTSQQRWLASFANQPAAQQQTAATYWHQQQRSAAYYWWQRALQNGSEKAYAALQRYFPDQSPNYLGVAAQQGHPDAIQQLALVQLNSPLVTWQQWLQRWSQARYQRVLADPIAGIWQWLPGHAECQRTLAVYPMTNGSKRKFVELLAELSASNFNVPGLCFKLHATGEQPPEPAVDGDFPIVLKDRGGASVNAQRMVLTSDSTGRVLAHELGHVLGLADEYPLRPEIAQAFCHGQYQRQALNVVMTDKQLLTRDELRKLWLRLPWQHRVSDWRQLAQQRPNGLWRLGSDRLNTAVGLYPAATCDAIDGVFAWKPVANVTAMERHQSDHWPALYQQLLYKANAN